MASSNPEKTGPYRHIQLIYSGESSQLWKAVDTRNGQTVGIKRLLPQAIGKRGTVALFQREFHWGELLEGDGFIEYYEMGKDDGIPYLAMEWFPAPSVKQIVNQGYGDYAPSLTQLIPALFKPLIPLHQAGIVHRDIKPDNYLYSPDGKIKLIDFSIAKKAGGGLFRLFGKNSQTQGTATYIAPEQIESKKIDPRSDLYSLGCSILELLTGASPFTGNSLRELLQKHLTGPIPSALTKNKNVTPQFDAFLQTLLAHRPEDRPQSAQEALTLMSRIPIFVRPPQFGDKVG